MGKKIRELRERIKELEKQTGKSKNANYIMGNVEQIAILGNKNNKLEENIEELKKDFESNQNHAKKLKEDQTQLKKELSLLKKEITSKAELKKITPHLNRINQKIDEMLRWMGDVLITPLQAQKIKDI